MGSYLRVGTDIVNHSISSKFRLILILFIFEAQIYSKNIKVVVEGKPIHGHMVG